MSMLLLSSVYFEGFFVLCLHVMVVLTWSLDATLLREGGMRREWVAPWSVFHQMYVTEKLLRYENTQTDKVGEYASIVRSEISPHPLCSNICLLVGFSKLWVSLGAVQYCGCEITVQKRVWMWVTVFCVADHLPKFQCKSAKIMD